MVIVQQSLHQESNPLAANTVYEHLPMTFQSCPDRVVEIVVLEMSIAASMVLQIPLDPLCSFYYSIL